LVLCTVLCSCTDKTDAADSWLYADGGSEADGTDTRPITDPADNGEEHPGNGLPDCVPDSIVDLTTDQLMADPDGDLVVNLRDYCPETPNP